jgi:GWxTD domain-containing protein
MRILELFVDTSLAQMIGWALLHTLWEGAIISALLAAVLIGIRSPRARYTAACAAMLVMLAAFGLTVVHLMPEQAHSVNAHQASSFVQWKPFSGTDGSSSWNFSLSSIAPWLGPLWFIGVCLICVWRTVSWVFAQRLRRRGLCCASDHWQKKIAAFSTRLRVSQTVLLLESCLTEVPVVLGHFRPMILIPVGLLAGLPTAQVEAILIHELAHIRRHDYLANVLQSLVEALFFYHPAAWWMSKIIRTEREHCCDDVVISICGAHEYALALAALEGRRLSALEATVAATGGHLMKRIRRILEPKAPRSVWMPPLSVAIVLAATAVSLAAWQSDPPRQISVSRPSQTSRITSDSYVKWLNQEVVYIVDDTERAAFLQLTTDEQRKAFIDQFWERRNPTPGSPTNKFKSEHYRRIAYSNQHFRTASGAPGWQTDRGHIYIVYGPPDELETHPKRPDRPFATEIWLYRHVEGIGDNDFVTFLDKTGTGDFHLAPGNATADAKPRS